MGTHPIFESDFDCLTEMGRTDEICFEAPEISMSSDITIDAILSMVTVSKLTNMKVDANCHCPGKETVSGNSNANNNRALSGTPPLEADPAPVAKPVVEQADPAPVAAPEEPESAASAPTESTPADPVPNESAAAEPTPVEPITAESTPADPAPAEPATEESTPAEPLNADPAPAEPEVVVAEPTPVVQAEPEETNDEPVVAEPANVQTAPAEIPTETAGAIDTAEDTSLETTVNDTTSNISLLEYSTDISVAGEFTSKWKTLNVPGEYELLKEDEKGRPIYKRKEPTSDGGAVYLYHIHHSKKWRVGPNHEGKEAFNCWLYITSKVDQPLSIAKDQERTGRSWKEFDTSTGKWLEVKNMKITQL